jgi:hypothetical protein
MTRTDAVIQIRDHVLAIIRRHGRLEPLGSTSWLVWRGADFSIGHRTPFQPWDTPDAAVKALAADLGTSLEQAKYLAVLNGLKLPEILPYGLDIWQGRKVLNLEWDDAGAVHLAGFKRGPWEAQFLALAV